MAETSGTRKRRTAQERRAEIIQAAVKLFARQGFARTSTREIAGEAGISEGTIFKYFATKQDILLAFIEGRSFTQMPEILQAMEQDDGGTRLREVMLGRLQLWDENRDLMRVVIGEALFNPALAAGVHAIMAPFFHGIEEYIARRMREGVFREMDPRLAARALIGNFWTYFLLWRLLFPETEQPVDQPDTIQNLLDLFLHGLRQPAAGRSAGET